MTEPTPTAYEMAKDAIAAAGTEEDARAAVATAVAAGITGAQLQSLDMAVDARLMALADMKAAEERKMLVEAAMCDAATAACVAAHDALIAALEKDLADLQASDDATNAQEQAAQMAVSDAKAVRDMVAMSLADLNRNTETGMKVTAAEMAANGLEDERSAEDIAAAEEAIMAAKTAIAAGDDPDAFMAEIEAAEMAVARAKARNAVDMAVMAARKYSAMLTDDRSEAAVMKARMAVDDAKTAVEANADDLTEADEAGFNAQITLAEAPIGPLESQIATMETEEADRMAEEMAATAMKLFDGINAPDGDIYADGSRDGASEAAQAGNFDARWGKARTDGPWAIHVGDATARANGTIAEVPVVLTEDKDTTVASNYGWQGSRWVLAVADDGDPAGSRGSTYEAIVYSNPGEPTMGKKFGSAAAVAADGDFQYQLDAADRNGNANKALTYAAADHAALVVLPSVTRSAGTETFKLPEENPGGTQYITLSGSLHGVSGTFSCAPTTPADGCTAAVAAKGFTLAGGTWLFIPSDANARVTDVPDAVYASYGWWIRTAENGGITASAFDSVRGLLGEKATRNNTDVSGLNGTATYMGGAAGKYAISAPTGGTNEAGHFTAKSMLQANFGAPDWSLTGMIDDFKVGDDGEARDWSVALTFDAPTTTINLEPCRMSPM